MFFSLQNPPSLFMSNPSYQPGAESFANHIFCIIVLVLASVFLLSMMGARSWWKAQALPLLKHAALSLLMVALLGITFKFAIPVINEMAADEARASHELDYLAEPPRHRTSYPMSERLPAISERLYPLLALLVILYNALLIVSSLALSWRAKVTLLLPPLCSFGTDRYLFHETNFSSAAVAILVLTICLINLWPRTEEMTSPREQFERGSVWAPNQEITVSR